MPPSVAENSSHSLASLCVVYTSNSGVGGRDSTGIKERVPVLPSENLRVCIMSESRLEKSPIASSLQKSLESASQSSLTYPVRRMRNTAVLVKWIEEHQNNPYPTKAEKQYLAYYSGMNLTQLSTWFANARRRIKKIGMKTWLEGRSTFTVDFFPAQRHVADSYGVAGEATA